MHTQSRSALSQGIRTSGDAGTMLLISTKSLLIDGRSRQSDLVLGDKTELRARSFLLSSSSGQKLGSPLQYISVDCRPRTTQVATFKTPVIRVLTLNQRGYIDAFRYRSLTSVPSDSNGCVKQFTTSLENPGQLSHKIAKRMPYISASHKANHPNAGPRARSRTVIGPLFAPSDDSRRGLDVGKTLEVEEAPQPISTSVYVPNFRLRGKRKDKSQSSETTPYQPHQPLGKRSKHRYQISRQANEPSGRGNFLASSDNATIRQIHTNSLISQHRSVQVYLQEHTGREHATTPQEAPVELVVAPVSISGGRVMQQTQVDDNSGNVAKSTLPFDRSILRAIEDSDIVPPEGFKSESLGMANTGILNLHSSQRLSYPDLSLSSFASTSNVEQNSEISNSESLRGPLLELDPPQSVSGYHIPDKIMDNAINAGPNSDFSYWKFSLYRGPDGSKPKVHYCKTKAQSEDVAQLFAREPVIGFDMEWKPSASKAGSITDNVSLIQIASEERIALFHIARFTGSEPEDFVAPTLRTIVESRDITKVGVAIKGDCTRLRKYLNIHSQGLFELSHLQNVLKSRSEGIVTVSKRLFTLASQVQEHLGLPLKKDHVRTSDWSRDLNHAQIQYAASDSYAGLQLYKIMNAKRMALSPVAPCPSHAELDAELLLFEPSVAPTPLSDTSDNIESSGEDSFSESDFSTLDRASEASLDTGLDRLSLTSDEPCSSILPADSNSIPRKSPCLPHAVSSRDKAEHSRLIESANAWIDAYQQSKRIFLRDQPISSSMAVDIALSEKKSGATHAQLRAYYLWHERDNDVPVIAGILRDPPLALSTVVGYICAAMCEENLPRDTAKVAQLDRHGNIYMKEHQRLVTNAQKRVTATCVKSAI